ncbi:oligosaccharide flippase family protein, partial [Flavihumibacter sp. CACIAM 22H1]|uniref:oligosaccharide flippase family protein n=1 Tax=Flavihumibacter sp. CACIAM 22H1 TaxID=1812911 RepID=UPI0007A93257
YIVACTLLINQLSAGQKVLLQGTRKIAELAKASVFGGIIGLIFSLPLYYFFKENGIAMSILCSSILSFIFSTIYSKRLDIKAIYLPRKALFTKAKGMITLGFFLSISNLASTGFSYLFRIYLSNQGSLIDVGYYNAGFAIIGTYVGLVFTAMATDYYPRLASVASNNEQCRDEINQQLEMAIIILSPILCGFIFYIDWALVLLYSSEFNSIRTMSIWAAYGVYFKAASWSIAYLFLAKGASRLFFYNEIFTHCYLFILNIIFYKFWGLNGVGVSYLVGYILHFLQMWIVAKIKYDFSLSKKFIRVFIFQLLFGTVSLLMSLLFEKNILFYIVASFIYSILLVSTFFILDRRIELRRNFLKKFYSR